MHNTKQSLRLQLDIKDQKQGKSFEEEFQNEILRPILKLQHDLILAFFHRHVTKRKVQFTGLSQIQKNEYTLQLFKKDQSFIVELRGLILGLLDLEEYEKYQTKASDLNKRISSMALKRIQSTF